LTSHDHVDQRDQGDVDGPLDENESKRNAQRSREYLWKNKVVPYTFSSKMRKYKKLRKCSVLSFVCLPKRMLF